MRLPREVVYRLMAMAKGDLPATPEQRRTARAEYRALLDGLTREIQEQTPGDLSITHESVEFKLEQAYQEYCRQQERRGRRRRLPDVD